MNDDFNTPVLVAHLFEAVRIINSVNDKKEKLTESDISKLKRLMHDFVFDVMGLKSEEENSRGVKVLDDVMKFILEMRHEAKAKKDFATSDAIRNYLTDHGIQIKDGKEGSTWTFSN